MASNAKIRAQLNHYFLDKEPYSPSHFLQLYSAKKLVRPLFSTICSNNPRIKWQAVTLFGQVIAKLADEDIEYARVVMRRFLWSLNDESGGIGWGAPETMAEAMLAHPQLRHEYLHMLSSYIKEDGEELFQDGNHLELPELQQGVLWGLWRLACHYPNLIIEQDVALHLPPYLQSTNSQVVGLALLLHSALGLPPVKAEQIKIANKKSFSYYSEGGFQTAYYSDFITL